MAEPMGKGDFGTELLAAGDRRRVCAERQPTFFAVIPGGHVRGMGLIRSRQFFAAPASIHVRLPAEEEELDGTFSCFCFSGEAKRCKNRASNKQCDANNF